MYRMALERRNLPWLFEVVSKCDHTYRHQREAGEFRDKPVHTEVKMKQREKQPQAKECQ